MMCNSWPDNVVKHHRRQECGQRPELEMRTLPTLALAVLLAVLGGCGSSTTPTTGQVGGTVSYVGAFASPAESGTLMLTSVAASTAVSGSLVLLNGQTFAVNGTLAASGAFSISGGGYSFTGTLANSVVTGTYSGPNGAGQFAAQAPVASGSASSVYCGTFVAKPDFGWFSAVVSSTGVVAGFAVPAPGSSGVAVTFSGTITGTTLSAISSQNVSIQGTRSADGTSLSGTFVPNGGGTGTFSGSTGACGTTASGGTAPPSEAGPWAGAVAQASSRRFDLTQSGASGRGPGTIFLRFVPPLPGTHFPTPHRNF